MVSLIGCIRRVLQVAYTHLPHLALAGFALWTFHTQCDDIVSIVVAIGMYRVLLGRSGAVAEVPVPVGDTAITAVVEADGACVRHYRERPVALHWFSELFLQRHQREESLHRGVAIHLMML